MIKEVENGVIFTLRIVPNSSRNELIIEEEFIKVKVTAQPIENKANKALVELLSKTLKVPKTSIQIVKGETSKEKTIFIKTQDSMQKKIISQLTKK